jgi:hypothetical protein
LPRLSRPLEKVKRQGANRRAETDQHQQEREELHTAKDRQQNTQERA